MPKVMLSPWLWLKLLFSQELDVGERSFLCHAGIEYSVEDMSIFLI